MPRPIFQNETRGYINWENIVSFSRSVESNQLVLNQYVESLKSIFVREKEVINEQIYKHAPEIDCSNFRERRYNIVRRWVCSTLQHRHAID